MPFSRQQCISNIYLTSGHWFCAGSLPYYCEGELGRGDVILGLSGGYCLQTDDGKFNCVLFLRSVTSLDTSLLNHFRIRPLILIAIRPETLSFFDFLQTHGSSTLTIRVHTPIVVIIRRVTSLQQVVGCDALERRASSASNIPFNVSTPFINAILFKYFSFICKTNYDLLILWCVDLIWRTNSRFLHARVIQNKNTCS